MKFEVIGYADISTAYLEESDLALLQSAPHHLAEIDGGVGTILWIPSDPDLLERFVSDARSLGLSDRLINIVTELHKQKIAYVRFDADGGEIEDLDRIQD